MPQQSLADLLRTNPWGAPPTTPLARTVSEARFDPTLGFSGAVDTYLSRLKKMQGGLAQDMLDTAADPNAEGIQRAANLLGGLGLKIANVPMALMPSSQELRDRGYHAGASPEVQALGGALGDAVNIPDPATVGPALATLVKAGATAKALAAGAAPLLKSAAVAPLGKGLASLLADASPAEQAALKARLEAEAAQTGGQAVGVSRDQALENLVNQPQRSGLTTASYKETYPDGTTQWAPGIYRANPTTAERFQPEMTPGELKRYIEQYGEPPLPRAKGEVVTGKRKDYSPEDGTVTPVPGLLRTKRPSAQASSVSREQALNGLTGALKDWRTPNIRDVTDKWDTPVFHATGSEFEDFRPSYRGSSFFADTPEAAVKGSQRGGKYIINATVPSEEISGLAFTPKEKTWFDSLPDVVTESQVDELMKSKPSKNIGDWYNIFDEIQQPDGTFVYRKKPESWRTSYADAKKTGLDVYGRQIAHWGPQSDEALAAKRALDDGMSGHIIQDETGLAVAMANPNRIWVRGRK